MRYSNEWLLDRLAIKERPKYLFFWGHQPSADGSVSASCFSQWWSAPFVVDGRTFRTAEHWMMAGKAVLFSDEAMLARILEAKTPGEAKKLGRLVQGFDAATWDARKMDIVVEGNCHKFSQHPDLKDYLLKTGDRVLVEASPVDRIWGIGMTAANPKAEHPASWRGQNLLGYALMEVRDMLGGKPQPQTEKQLE